MLLLRLFRGAGSTGHVFLLNGGKASDKGVAYSGLIGPMTTVAVIPTMPHIVNFAIEAQTSDNQKVVVRGNLPVTFVPSTARSKFDFTVDPKTGEYIAQWEPAVNAKVTEQVLRVVLDKVKEIKVEAAVVAQKEIGDEVDNKLGQENLATDGMSAGSCSIHKIEPKDDEVTKAIGVVERQAMLAAADKAVHDRRAKAAENERALKEYEAGTLLELEKKKKLLIEEQSKNKEEEAKGDAKAIGIRFAELNKIEPGKLLGASIMDAAKSGRLGSLAITSEFLAAVNQK